MMFLTKKTLFPPIGNMQHILLSDLADSEHPSPVYHNIIKGIFSRINQLAPEGESVSSPLQKRKPIATS